ncbi:MAG: TetR/AcrR family transcriptional regulator [Alphaproteobacteria bacterium]|uniref:TetR/AcrR family transcriptional regulator n=1 Tax=Candidatus Nitrobium versatile TaxID=2884831 RepID=A0A953SGC0_9BACT|nr:TetR/AcrR family transcriptional regulator [Candidatus Nitrobium versatile]
MEECTIRDIARKAGVSPASVVVHFKSKTALLEEVLSGDIGKAVSELSVSVPKSTGLLDRLMYLSKGFFSLYNENRALYRGFIRYTVFEPASETPLMSRITEQYLRFLSGIIEEEKTRGVVRPEVDSTVAAASVFSLYMGALITFFREPEMTVEMVTDLLASMTDCYLRGIIRSGQSEYCS